MQYSTSVVPCSPPEFLRGTEDVRMPSSAPKTVTSGPCTPRAWLEQWPTARRSLISNLFHCAVRDGATTPALVVSAVQATLRRRLQYAPLPFDATTETLHAVWQALQTTPQEAYVHARAVLDWEALPAAERQRQKAARAQHYQRAYMATLSPTEKQINFLRQRGYTQAPANRADASALIDGLLRASRKDRP